MTIRRIICLLLFIQGLSALSAAQTLGGNSIFNFLRLSNTPRLTALGGVNITHPATEAGLAFQAPALLQPSMDKQLHLAFNGLYAGASVYHISYTFQKEKWGTRFNTGLQFFNYGKATATDASGNILGEFRAADMMLQLSAARTYLQRWNYGMSLKFVSSRYGAYRANGLAVDIGVLYTDSSGGFRASVMMKNAGLELKKYNEGSSEELPFEMQAGISQRLKASPFGFSLTAQQLHRFDLRYADSSYEQAGGLNSKPARGLGKFMDHLVMGATLYLNEKLELDLGYNFLRRRDLNISGNSNGLNGFSYGFDLRLKKFLFQFARAHYQSNTAYNQAALTLDMSQFW